VSRKTYETERVPVARKTRFAHIIVSCVCIVGGLLLFLPTIFDTYGSDVAVPRVYGVLIGGLGIFFLIRSIRRTHEAVLTERGKAAKAVDDRIESARIAKRDAAFWTVAFWAVVIVGIIYAYDPIIDQFENRIAVYAIVCNASFSESGACRGRESAGNVTRYFVHVNEQTVVRLTEHATAPEKLFNCVVADRKNWKCSLGPDQGAVQATMRDGVFSYHSSAEDSWPTVHFTSRWNYLLTKYLKDN
jgi:hypothetical protein